jgi:cyclic pyranopterin phosphate synthase
MSKLTHLDQDQQPQMVDVSAKAVTTRTAVARADIALPEEVWALLDGEDFSSAKGPVLQTAMIAGTMAAKQTGQLIPLCHPLGLDDCQFVTEWHRPVIRLLCKVQTTAKTGVEMEALTGASLAALTVYDMLKAVSHDIEIRSVCLQSKSGGKRDFQRQD